MKEKEAMTSVVKENVFIAYLHLYLNESTLFQNADMKLMRTKLQLEKEDALKQLKYHLQKVCIVDLQIFKLL